MDEELKKKAESIFYFMTKACARQSWVDFLSELDCNREDWAKIKKEITDKTGIEFKYL